MHSCPKYLNVFTKQLREDSGGRVSAYSQEGDILQQFLELPFTRAPM